jgi:hypothetical protein
MNIKILLIVSAVFAVSSAQADAARKSTESQFNAQIQVANKIEPEELPPVEDEELEELLGHCPVYPACPPGF